MTRLRNGIWLTASLLLRSRGLYSAPRERFSSPHVQFRPATTPLTRRRNGIWLTASLHAAPESADLHERSSSPVDGRPSTDLCAVSRVLLWARILQCATRRLSSGVLPVRRSALDCASPSRLQSFAPFAIRITPLPHWHYAARSIPRSKLSSFLGDGPRSTELLPSDCSPLPPFRFAFRRSPFPGRFRCAAACPGACPRLRPVGPAGVRPLAARRHPPLPLPRSLPRPSPSPLLLNVVDSALPLPFPI